MCVCVCINKCIRRTSLLYFLLLSIESDCVDSQRRVYRPLWSSSKHPPSSRIVSTFNECGCPSSECRRSSDSRSRPEVSGRVTMAWHGAGCLEPVPPVTREPRSLSCGISERNDATMGNRSVESNLFYSILLYSVRPVCWPVRISNAGLCVGAITGTGWAREGLAECGEKANEES